MQPKSSYLYLNELRVHYFAWGEADSARSAVLLHGLASNARIWELTAPLLAESGYRVLAPDLRGHGLTDKPDGDYGFRTFQRDLGAFIDMMDLNQPALVGHSWGAFLALDFAAAFFAGRFSPKKLVMVDGGLTQLDSVPGADWEQIRERLKPPKLLGMSVDEFLARLDGVSGRWKPDERVKQIILANFEILDDETIAPHLTFERHMQIVRAMWEFDTFKRMGLVNCPVQAVLAEPDIAAGEGDMEYLALKRQSVETAARLIRDFQVEWIKSGIHDLPLQIPEKLAEIIAKT